MSAVSSLILSLTFCHIVSKGNASHLLKATARRRRSKAQIQEEKKQEELKEAETAAKLAQMDQMQQEMQAMQE